MWRAVSTKIDLGSEATTKPVPNSLGLLGPLRTSMRTTARRSVWSLSSGSFVCAAADTNITGTMRAARLAAHPSISLPPPASRITTRELSHKKTAGVYLPQIRCQGRVEVLLFWQSRNVPFVQLDRGVHTLRVPVKRRRCVKKARRRHAVRKTKEGPSESPCRGRFQTAGSC